MLCLFCTHWMILFCVKGLMNLFRPKFTHWNQWHSSSCDPEQPQLQQKESVFLIMTSSPLVQTFDKATKMITWSTVFPCGWRPWKVGLLMSVSSCYFSFLESQAQIAFSHANISRHMCPEFDIVTVRRRNESTMKQVRTDDVTLRWRRGGAGSLWSL